MQKLVIDTNVMVSSLIQRSFPYKIVNPVELSALTKTHKRISHETNRRLL